MFGLPGEALALSNALMNQLRSIDAKLERLIEIQSAILNGQGEARRIVMESINGASERR